MEGRGEIEVKGKGKMQTYFLQRNLKATESEIMGLLVHNTDSVRKMTHSGRDCGSQLPHYRAALKGLLNICLSLGYQLHGKWIGVLLYILNQAKNPILYRENYRYVR